MQRLFLMPFSIVFICVIYYLLNSTNFERIPPSASLYLLKDKSIYPLDTSYFNAQNDIKLSAYDSSGLSSFSVSIKDSNGNLLLKENEILTKKSKKIDIILPKAQNLQDKDIINYDITITDWSNANFFTGNKTHISKQLNINNIAPKIQIVATSEQITYGGSALVAFQVIESNSQKDSNPKNLAAHKVYLSNGKNTFKAYPYINKQGVLIYLALIAWPITNTFFEGKIYAYDKANNEQILTIPIATNINFARKKYNFALSDAYLARAMSRLKNMKFPNEYKSDIEKFEYFNKTIRTQDMQRISDLHRISFSVLNDDFIENLPKFNVFYPLKKSSNVSVYGKFGDEYTYRYKNENIGIFTRFGIDMSANRGAAVVESNEGEIVFYGNLGEYGNVAVISHYLGLNAMYGYLHDIQKIPTLTHPLDTIGYTGESGLAGLNSVYFATLVQGYFVNPQEWMNAEWIDKNINQVLEKAQNFGMRY